MPPNMTYTEMANYPFDLPVTITCTRCGRVISEGAYDVADAWGAAREHDHDPDAGDRD